MNITVKKCASHTKQLLALLLVAFAVSGEVAAQMPQEAAPAAALQGWTAGYRVLHGNSTVGQAQFRLEATGDGASMLLESRTRAQGIAKLLRSREVVESSTFVATGERLTPLAYRFEDGTRKAKKNMHIDFDPATRQAVSLYQGETYPLDLDDGTLDRLLVILGIMRDVARNTLADAYLVADKREVKTYYLEGPLEETVQTPAGTFETLHYTRLREGSSRSMEIWLAPELGYLPVRMRHLKEGKETARLELTESNKRN